MNYKLKLADLFIRGRRMTRWLELVDLTVCGSLVQLIKDKDLAANVARRTMPRAPVQYRKAMAEKHARLVDMLIDEKGEEIGISEGRKAMHDAGLVLGRKLRSELGLSDEIDDLVGAARLLYHILGIEFEIERTAGGSRMLVRRCALSEHYSPMTCQVISAMDEGVVTGLNPHAKMTFTKRNIADQNRCEAELALEDIR